MPRRSPQRGGGRAKEGGRRSFSLSSSDKRRRSDDHGWRFSVFFGWSSFCLRISPGLGFFIPEPNARATFSSIVKQPKATLISVSDQSSQDNGVSAEEGVAAAEKSSSAWGTSPAILPPRGQFRTTKPGEVSLVSFNVLASTFQGLSIWSSLTESDKEQEVKEEEEDGDDDDSDDDLAVRTGLPAKGRTSLLSPEKSLSNDRLARIMARDRRERLPRSLRMAKQRNADLLCLQEVEGGPLESAGEDFWQARVRPWLAQEEPAGADGSVVVPGYDQAVWSPLHPHRPTEVVGLAVAWRSTRHQLVSMESFRRGMLVQLLEVATGATLVVVNLHLPAKPSAVEGRLRAVAAAMQRLQGLESFQGPSQRGTAGHATLDGLLLVSGDLNCDEKSVAVQYLQKGYTQYGTLRDRNYKARLSKVTAAAMRHPFRLADVYASVRSRAAPVTVSLQGRGPGCMDHILFDSLRRPAGMDPGGLTWVRPNKPRPPGETAVVSKRRARRERAQSSAIFSRDGRPSGAGGGRVQLEAVLATIDPLDPERTDIIQQGLPNLEQGFPSDHLPVGALFSSREELGPVDGLESVGKREESTNGGDHTGTESRRRGALSASAQQRRQAAESSTFLRRRHNAVLRVVANFLLSKGAAQVMRDKPLYKWPWVQGLTGLRKKMRAPDLVCVVGGHRLVMVEVSVSTQPESIRTEKVGKYQDLVEALQGSPQLKQDGLVVEPTFVLVLSEVGDLPDLSRKDLERLLFLVAATEEETRNLVEALKILCNDQSGEKR